MSGVRHIYPVWTILASLLDDVVKRNQNIKNSFGLYPILAFYVYYLRYKKYCLIYFCKTEIVKFAQGWDIHTRVIIIL